MKSAPESLPPVPSPPVTRWLSGATIVKRTTRTPLAAPPTWFIFRRFAAENVEAPTWVKFTPSEETSTVNWPVEAESESPHVAVGSTTMLDTSVWADSAIVIERGPAGGAAWPGAAGLVFCGEFEPQPAASEPSMNPLGPQPADEKSGAVN